MPEESEIVRLMLALSVLVPLAMFYKATSPTSGIRLLCLGTLLMVIAAILSVAKAFWLPVLLGFLQSACYAGTGVLFVSGCWLLRRETTFHEVD